MILTDFCATRIRFMNAGPDQDPDPADRKNGSETLLLNKNLNFVASCFDKY